MKRIITACILTVCMILCCGIVLFSLHNSIQRLMDTLEQAENLVSAGNYNAAVQLLEETSGRWEKEEHIFSRLLRHKELETVTLNLASLPAYLEYQDLSNFQATVRQIRQMLAHIWEAELPIWSNLL